MARKRGIGLVTTGIMMVAVCFAIWAGPADANHNPRLFTRNNGDHGGIYRDNSGQGAFYWLNGGKRFNSIKVCVWKVGRGNLSCKNFKVRRVPAASYSPWGIDFNIKRKFPRVKTGETWNLRFRQSGRPLSPVLGFHRG